MGGGIKHGSQGAAGQEIRQRGHDERLALAAVILPDEVVTLPWEAQEHQATCAHPP